MDPRRTSNVFATESTNKPASCDRLRAPFDESTTGVNDTRYAIGFAPEPLSWCWLRAWFYIEHAFGASEPS